MDLLNHNNYGHFTVILCKTCLQQKVYIQLQKLYLTNQFESIIVSEIQ